MEVLVLAGFRNCSIYAVANLSIATGHTMQIFRYSLYEIFCLQAISVQVYLQIKTGCHG
jgi:hypothetical protein